jgi:hypothetical protein
VGVAVPVVPLFVVSLFAVSLSPMPPLFKVFTPKGKFKSGAGRGGVLASRARRHALASSLVAWINILLILFGLIRRRALYRYSGIKPPCAVNSNIHPQTKPIFFFLSLSHSAHGWAERTQSE